MQLCIPVQTIDGLNSAVSAHFGSATAFCVASTESAELRFITNNNDHHGHGMCAPLAMLEGQNIDGIVVGGIGVRAMQKLMAAGMQVYRTQEQTVRSTLQAYKAGTLPKMQLEETCAGHHH